MAITTTPPTLVLLKLLLFYTLLLISPSTSKPIYTNQDAESFLQQFGYLSKPPTSNSNDGPKVANLQSSSDSATTNFKDAILQYQRDNGLVESGYLNYETRNLMERPRCGNGKSYMMVQEENNVGRKKRYAISALKWNKLSLTYQLHNYSPDLTDSIISSELNKAFAIWSDHSRLTFQRVYSGNADLNLHFYKGQHGDGYPFDGTGGVLAHAFYPRNGRVHFDEDERWDNGRYDVLLSQVAAHEIGHAIGLKHSSDKTAIMYASYSYKGTSFGIEVDDRKGIEYLYNCNPIKGCYKDPPPPKKKASCFSGDNTVKTLVVSKEKVGGNSHLGSYVDKAMKQLQIGDYVETANGFKEIIGFLHRQPNLISEFLLIKTSNHNTSIKITHDHLIAKYNNNVNLNNLLPEYIPASKLRINDNLGNNRFIQSIEIVQEKGIYAPLTKDGTIIVNGFLASCYAYVNNHHFANMYFYPWRLVGKYFDLESIAEFNYRYLSGVATMLGVVG